MNLRRNTSFFEHRGMGWIPDSTDLRDYRLDEDEIFKKLGSRAGKNYLEKLNYVLKELRDKLEIESGTKIDSALNALEDEIKDSVDIKIYRILRLGSVGKQVSLLKYYLVCFYAVEYIKNGKSSKDRKTATNHITQIISSHLKPEKQVYSLDVLSNSEYTEELQIMVIDFQKWAKSNLEGMTEIEVDGQVGIDTFRALEYWLRSQVPIQDLSHEKPAKSVPIPFPAVIPTDIFIKIIIFFNEDDSFQNLQCLKNQELQEVAQTILKKHFLVIEPIVSVILQMLGPIGAYNNLETALEIALEKFQLLLSDKVNLASAGMTRLNRVRMSHIKRSDRLKHPKHLENLITILDLELLGNSEKLPDEFMEELNEEINNLEWLRSCAIWAVLSSYQRLTKQQFSRDNNIYKVLSSIIQKCKNHINIPDLKELEGVQKKLIKIEEDQESERKEVEELNDNFDKVLECLNVLRKSRFLKSISIEADFSSAKKFGSSSNEISTNSADFVHFYSKYRIPVGTALWFNWRDAEDERGSKYGDRISEPTVCFTHLPDAVDLSFWCSPISDQGRLNSCTAHAGAALIEYFSIRYLDDYDPLSARFLYKATRSLMRRQGDTGASLRETIKAMISLGVPPAKHWQYDEEKFDEEPPSLCYSFAQNYQTLNYFRLDQPNLSNEELLARIKVVLAAGFPCMFGCTLHESIYEKFNVERGYIPCPSSTIQDLRQQDKAVGGHALVAVGYHDYKRIRQSRGREFSNPGALMVRNCWGTGWGINGYGWLPYDYVLSGLTSDWWSLLMSEWLQSGKFGLGGDRDFGGNQDVSGGGNSKPKDSKSE